MNVQKTLDLSVGVQELVNRSVRKTDGPLGRGLPLSGSNSAVPVLFLIFAPLFLSMGPRMITVVIDVDPSVEISDSSASLVFAASRRIPFVTTNFEFNFLTGMRFTPKGKTVTCKAKELKDGRLYFELPSGYLSLASWKLESVLIKIKRRSIKVLVEKHPTDPIVEGCVYFNLAGLMFDPGLGEPPDQSIMLGVPDFNGIERMILASKPDYLPAETSLMESLVQPGEYRIDPLKNAGLFQPRFEPSAASAVAFYPPGAADFGNAAWQLGKDKGESRYIDTESKSEITGLMDKSKTLRLAKGKMVGLPFSTYCIRGKRYAVDAFFVEDGVMDELKVFDFQTRGWESAESAKVDFNETYYQVPSEIWEKMRDRSFRSTGLRIGTSQYQEGNASIVSLYSATDLPSGYLCASIHGQGDDFMWPSMVRIVAK